MCAKSGSNWFRNMDLYKVQTNKQTNKNEQKTILALYIRLIKCSWKNVLHMNILRGDKFDKLDRT